MAGPLGQDGYIKVFRDAVGDYVSESVISAGSLDTHYLRKNVTSPTQTMLAPLAVPADGFTVGTNQIVAAGGRVGFGRTPLGSMVEIQGDLLVTGSVSASNFTGGAGVDATSYKGNSTPTAAEFGRLAGVTSGLQSQLDSKEPAISGGGMLQYWRGDKSWAALDKAAVGLPNVENTALSTWPGSTNLTTLGTVSAGTWQGATVANSRGGTGTGTVFTEGSVVYAGASGVYAQANAGLFYDASNVRLGVGTATPEGALHVSSAETTSLKVSTSGGAGAGRAVLQIFRGPTASAYGWDFLYNDDLASENFSLRELTNGAAATRATFAKGSGFVGFGAAPDSVSRVHVAGDLNVTGTFRAGGAQLAVLAAQAANLVYAGPSSGAAAAPSFRALVSNDVPNLDAGKISTGTLAVARGGTGTGTSFVAGSVIFAGAGGAYAEDASNLVWDDSNNRLGVGTSAPGSRLSVMGDAALTATAGTQTALAVSSAAGTPASRVDAFKVNVSGTDALAVGIGDTLSGGYAFSEKRFIHAPVPAYFGNANDPTQVYAAAYRQAVRIRESNGGDPNRFAKWQGLTVWQNLSGLTGPTTSTVDLYGIDVEAGIADTANTHNFYQVLGLQSVAFHKGAGNLTAGMTGTTGRANHEGSGTVAQANGAAGWARLMPTAGAGATMTLARGVVSIVSNELATGIQTTVAVLDAIMSQNSGTVGTLYVARLRAETTGSGTVTGNRYGLYIADQGVGTVNGTVYNLYSEGASRYNYFAGRIGVGVTAPGVAVDVSGTVRATTSYSLAGGQSWGAGLLHEGSGKVLSYAINAPQLGTRDTTRTGGIFRMDTRTSGEGVTFANGGQSFVIWGYPTGGSVDTTRLIVSLQDGTTSLVPSGGAVGVGTTSPNAAAMLHLESTTKVFLLMRMTTTQRDAIAGVPDGSLIYNSSVNKFQGRAAGAWVDLH